MNKLTEKTLITFERKILRKIFGPAMVDYQWQIRTNVELQKLYQGVNIGTFIKLQHLRCMGHLQGMDDARNTKKTCQANLYQK
jgi:hypothetical protein